MSTLYLICPHGDRLTKIGITTNLDARLRQLQTAYPYPLHVAASWDYDFPEQSRYMERCLHRILEPWKTSGEWFEFEAAAVSQLIDFMRQNSGVHELAQNPDLHGFNFYEVNRSGLRLQQKLAERKLVAIEAAAQALGIELHDEHDEWDQTNIGHFVLRAALNDEDY